MKLLVLLVISLVVAVCNAKSIRYWLDKLEDNDISLWDILDEAGKRKKIALPSADANLNIYALPVGQGDLTVIQCPSAYGGTISIIDAGSSANTGFTKSDVLDYLNGQYIERVILTHPHADHINYIGDILTQASKIPPVYHSCDWNTHYNPLINNPKITAKAIQIPKCCGTACPNYLICNKQVTLNIIASELVPCSNNRNKNVGSVVTKIEYANTVTLISGDFEGSQTFVNGFITCVGCANLKSDIYRLAHHGSYRNANRISILDNVQPKYAFVSSGLDQNNYHHPRCEVSDYLKAHYLVTTSYHPYVCYQSNGARDDTGTTKAIYSTTTVKGGYYVNNVIQFAISSTGAIAVSRKNV